jgi:hypothetical protein
MFFGSCWPWWTVLPPKKHHHERGDVSDCPGEPPAALHGDSWLNTLLAGRVPCHTTKKINEFLGTQSFQIID